jgi:signal transduction histidine kinase/DNA-binding response OmpR family regulator/HPt (histidine-containing phosphotransfer) domain-containing protein
VLKLSAEEANRRLQIAEGEKLLLRTLADCYNYDQLFDALYAYVVERWGFDTVSVQMVDYRKGCLHLGVVRTHAVDPEVIKRLVDNDIPLDENVSVSARIALAQTWYYADYVRSSQSDKLTAVDLDIVRMLNLKENLIVPVIHEKITLAVLHLTAIEKPLYLSRDTIQEILDFIQLLAPMIKFLQRHHDAIDLRNEQQAQIELVRRISTTPHLEGLVEIMGEELDLMVSPYGYMINLFDPDSGVLTCEKARFPDHLKSIEETYRGFRFDLSQDSIIRECLELDEIRLIHRAQADLLQDPFFKAFLHSEVASIAVIPIPSPHLESQALGTLVVLLKTELKDTRVIEKFQETLLYFMEPLIIVRQYSRLSEMTTLLTRAQTERKQALAFIKEINELTSVEDIYSRICSTFLEWFEFDCAAVLMAEEGVLVARAVLARTPDYDQLRADWERHLVDDPYPLEVNAGAFSNCFFAKVKLYFKDVRKLAGVPMSPRDAKWCTMHADSRTFLHLPILKDEKAIGVFSMITTSRNLYLSDEQMDLIQLLCSFVGGAIQNAALYSTVGQQKADIEEAMERLKTTQEQLLTAEKKRAEALEVAKETAEALADSKSRFLANMSHEIRTPMNAIIGLSDLALKRCPDSGLRDYLSKIDHSAKILLNIINDILDYSKIEAGKLTIESVEFSLGEVLGSMNDLFAEMMAQKSITFTIHADPAIPSLLIGDPHRIGQVLINLINNAFKFTEKGAIELKVSLLGKEGPMARLRFCVKDSGIGLQSDTLSMLFHSFTQADVSTTRRYGGTGLGLAICKSLVELMEGSISARSEPGKGSEFEFDVRLGYREDHRIFEVPACLRGTKILLADADWVSLQNSKSHLIEAGFDVDGVRSAHEVLNRLCSEPGKGKAYQVVLTDAHLPDMSTAEMVDAICRSVAPSRLELLLVGGPQTEEVLADYLSVEHIHLLAHPVTYTGILKAICEALLPEWKQPRQLAAQLYSEERVAPLLKGSVVLLAEDNEINQQVAVELLERVGVQVDVAENGKQALEALEKKVYQLLITDLQMPEMDGFECVRRLREMPRFQTLPILAMTAHALREERERCFELGVNDYLTKPIDVSELYRLLCVHLAPDTPIGAGQILEGQGEQKGTLGRQGKQGTEGKQGKEGKQGTEGKQGKEGKQEEQGKQDRQVSQSGTLVDILLNCQDQLTELDLPLALKRLGQNADLYVRLVSSVANKYPQIAEQIAEQINHGRLDQVVEWIHPFKGLCGNLGASALQTCCSEIEQAARQSAIQQVESAYAECVERVQHLFLDLAKVLHAVEQFQASLQPTSEASGETTQSLMMRLKTMIASNAFDLDEVVRPLAQKLKHPQHRAVLDEVMKAADNFDYTLAQENYNRLEQLVVTEQNG